jgi:hypothetical protein
LALVTIHQNNCLSFTVVYSWPAEDDAHVLGIPDTEKTVSLSQIEIKLACDTFICLVSLLLCWLLVCFSGVGHFEIDMSHVNLH